MTIPSMLGRGWHFPVLPLPVGTLSWSNGPDDVAQSIRIILETEPGERIMRPDFGCGLRRYLFEPNSVALRALIHRDVERALATWEPRIDVISIRVEPGEDPALVLIAIDYAHRFDRRPGNLVYPFYLE